MDATKKNTLLVVDDERLSLEIMLDILGDDYTIYMTKSGAAAVEMARKYSPDLILLDILMPDMNGFDVMEALKASSETRHIPVIFITGLKTVEDEEKGFDLGAVDFIHKPFNAKIVKARIRNHLQSVIQARFST